MRRRVATLALLLASSAAQAERDVDGWLHLGAGVAWREPDVAGARYDPGPLLLLDAESHSLDGLLLRVGYTYAVHDELTVGGVAAQKDIEQHEARIGAFWAPGRLGGLGFRIGGGYEYRSEDVDQPDREREQDGGFLEAGLQLEAGPALTFDFAALGFKVEGRGDDDSEAAELRARVVLHTRPVDYTLGLRYQALRNEVPPDEALYELRLGLGWDWDWGENR